MSVSHNVTNTNTRISEKGEVLIFVVLHNILILVVQDLYCTQIFAATLGELGTETS